MRTGRQARRSPLAKTRRQLRQIGGGLKKGLGQHLLIDIGVLEQIIEAAELTPSDIVIEVGAGLGVLTRELVERAEKVVAVEVDPRLAAVLSHILSSRPNLSIINADVLSLDPGELVAGAESYKVVANIPYYITSPILRHFLEARHKPKLMVLTLQREVADTIVAGPGELSVLALSVQFYGRPTLVSHVPASSFYPAPKVDSAVVRIDVYQSPAVAVSDVGGFFEVVRAGFSARRKQLRNSLAAGLGLAPAVAAKLLQGAGVSPQRRAGTLALEEWARVYTAYQEREKA